MPITFHCSDIITAFKDIAIAGSAITGACVAVKGLTEWKKQHRWNEDRKLAKELLKRSYQLHELINDIKDPMWRDISRANTHSKNQDKSEDEKTDADDAYFTKRWNDLNNVKSDFKPLILEAKVVWGKDKIQTMIDFIEHAESILSLFRRYLNQKRICLRDGDDQSFKKMNEAEDKVFRTKSNEDDFDKELTARLNKVEVVLSPFLDRPTQ